MVKLSHLDDQGRAHMVDVGEKHVTERIAVAKGAVVMKPETLKLITGGGIKKGDVLAAARLAGIMAAKRTADLIPLCHPLSLNAITVDLEPDADTGRLEISARVKVNGRTGVEMEALTAVSVAALTVYDMAKAVDRGMILTDIRLVEKSGGRSGDYKAQDAAASGSADLRSRGMRSTPHEGAPAVRKRRPRLSPRVKSQIAKREAFREYLYNNKIQVSAISKKAGVKLGEVYCYLNGQTPALRDEVAARLAKAAGVAVDDLFKG